MSLKEVFDVMKTIPNKSSTFAVGNSDSQSICLEPGPLWKPCSIIGTTKT